MAWLWSSSTDSQTHSPQQSQSAKSSKSYEAPDRIKRVQCWDARDAYFACLDRHKILDALADAETAGKNCGKESDWFEANCAASWVKYFKQRRVAEFEKERLLKKQEAESFGRRS